MIGFSLCEQMADSKEASKQFLKVLFKTSLSAKHDGTSERRGGAESSNNGEGGGGGAVLVKDVEVLN